jgi:GxxExxY protein
VGHGQEKAEVEAMNGSSPQSMSLRRGTLESSDITEGVIGAAIEVHRELGPGLLESAYEECLCYELSLRQFSFERQVELPVSYKGIQVGCNYRIDVLVEGEVVVELKATETVLPVHLAQLLTYLRLSGKHTGLLINFHVDILKKGIYRRVL